MLLPKLRTAKDSRRAWPGWGLIHSGNQRVPACPAVAPLGGSRNGAGVVRIQRTLVHCSHDPIRPNMPAHNRRHYVRFATSLRGVSGVPSRSELATVQSSNLSQPPGVFARSADPGQHVLTKELDEVHPLVELRSQVEHQVVDAGFPEGRHFSDDVVGRTGDQ